MSQGHVPVYFTAGLTRAVNCLDYVEIHPNCALICVGEYLQSYSLECIILYVQ